MSIPEGSEIRVGQRYRCTDGSISEVRNVSADRIAFYDEDCRDEFSWRRHVFCADHSPIAAPSPATSQHPADLKPRGVKAPMYLIPWAAVPFSLVPDSLSNVAEEIGEWPDGDAYRPNGDRTRFAHGLICDLVEVHGFTLEDGARAFEHGAKKYARDNWRTFQWDSDAKDEYFGAICRHLLAGVDEIDPDSGLTHGSHVLAGALIWAWHEGRS